MKNHKNVEPAVIPSIQSWRLRVATPADARRIAEIHVTSWRESYAEILPHALLDGLSIDDRESTWKANLSTPSSGGRSAHALVMEDDDDQLAGFVYYGHEYTGGATAEGMIHALYVLGAYHGQGLGKRLLKSAAAHLIQSGCVSMRLWVLSGNPAQSFYMHLGGTEKERQLLEVAADVRREHIAIVWRDLSRLACDEVTR